MTKRAAKKVQRNYKTQKALTNKLGQKTNATPVTQEGQTFSLDPRYGSTGDNFINTGGDFFNYTMAALANPKKSFVNYISNKHSEFWVRKFRRDMTNSTRIYLSPQFLEIAIELSFSYPKHIKRLIEKAVPPLDNVWIEWNEFDRFKATQKIFSKLGIDIANAENAQKNDTGYLIRKSPAGGFEYSCVFPSVTKKADKLFFPALTWHLNNDLSDPYTLSDMNKLRTAQNMELVDYATDEANRQKVIMALWGIDYFHIHRDTGMGDFLEPWQQNIQTGIHDLGYATYFELYTDKEDAKMAAAADEVHLGDMRFLMAVFSLLNYPRIVREGMPAPKKTKGFRWGRPVPKNEVKVIEIDLPKTRGTTVFQKLYTGQGAPKRQHWRRRHPRKYLDKNGNVKKIVWIEPMLVGNPELGVIEHEYFLRTKGDKYHKNRGAS